MLISILKDSNKVYCLIGLILFCLLAIVGTQKEQLKKRENEIEWKKLEIHQLQNDIDVMKQEIEQLKKGVEEAKQAKAVKDTSKVIKTPYNASTKATGINNSGLPEDNVCVVAMKQVFPQEDWQVAKAIIRAESGGNPKAVSKTNDHGCFQIHDWALYDPTENAKVALYKHNKYGWNPWTVFKTGKYLQYM